MKVIRKGYKFICHCLTSTNTKGHGIHSPFLFRLVENVVYDKHPFYAFEKIEKRRKELLKSNEIIFQEDFGTGKSSSKKISHIAKTSLKRKYWAQLLFRLVHCTKPKEIIELGTSLGITTSYLAKGNPSAKCFTFEGSEEIVQVANKTFQYVDAKNIEIVIGDINNTLKDVLAKVKSLDFVFFDANHQHDAVINYFNQCLSNVHAKTVFVFDDIHWSKGMERAWNEIRKHEKVTSTLDLHEIGIVFFDPHLEKKTFRLKGRGI